MIQPNAPHDLARAPLAVDQHARRVARSAPIAARVVTPSGPDDTWAVRVEIFPSRPPAAASGWASRVVDSPPEPEDAQQSAAVDTAASANFSASNRLLALHSNDPQLSAAARFDDPNRQRAVAAYGAARAVALEASVTIGSRLRVTA